MSVSELSTRERELISGTDISTDPSDFEPETTCPNRVYVNDVRVPVTDVDVHIRKEGPLAINRYAEVNFASPWNDSDYLSLFDTLKDASKQDKVDLLRIECRNNALQSEENTDAYNTLFHGFVTGVGGSEYDNQKVHQCRAQGFEHLLESIPASLTYGTEFESTKLLTDIQNAIAEKLPSSITISDGYSTSSESVIGEEESFIDFSLPLRVAKMLLTNKTFTANKHTLIDVINWFEEKSNQRVWFQPSSKGFTLVAGENPTKNSANHTAHYLGGDTQVINNNALSEIKPLNTVILNSSTRQQVDRGTGFSGTIASDTFYQVKARHKVLYQRNGEIELSDTIKKSDAASAEEAQREAKQKLKERIDGATSGSMQVIHNRFIQPFDTIEARPTTNSVTDEDISSLNYEVSRCHYKAHHNDNTMPHIDIQCGLKTDVEEDIEIIRTNEKDA